MNRTKYGRFLNTLLSALPCGILALDIPWIARALLAAGLTGLVMVLVDIRGLLLYPKEAKKELDPDYHQATIE